MISWYRANRRKISRATRHGGPWWIRNITVVSENKICGAICWEWHWTSTATRKANL